MNWILNKIKKILPSKKKSLDVPDNAWQKCKVCMTMLYADELEKTSYVCPNCDNHLKIHPNLRLKKLMDDEQYEIIKTPGAFQDPLNFKDTKTYKERFYAAQEKTNMDSAILVAYGKIKGIPVTCALHNFDFLGGSVGPSEAEALVKAAEHCVTFNTPLIVFTSSGGMRMMTNQYSLQALPKTTIAVQMLKDARLPYIVVLTDPTSGGVSASYASLGDITLAEPKASIMFAGASVTKNTTGEIMPEDVQKAEYLLEHGFIDQI
ncbi:MAG: acetyl-CoA carboxylase carboxyltransferase subunit beta, partial [Candidatus Pelagibacterales bacterium]